MYVIRAPSKQITSLSFSDEVFTWRNFHIETFSLQISHLMATCFFFLFFFNSTSWKVLKNSKLPLCVCVCVCVPCAFMPFIYYFRCFCAFFFIICMAANYQMSCLNVYNIARTQFVVYVTCWFLLIIIEMWIWQMRRFCMHDAVYRWEQISI